jgi:hypothetical protein
MYVQIFSKCIEYWHQKNKKSPEITSGAELTGNGYFSITILATEVWEPERTIEK